MDWMIMPLRRYADFSGRSRRKEYWLFTLFEAVLVGILALIDANVLTVIAVAALLVPNLAVQVRRFHDQDKSGWMILLGLIPFVGGLIVFVFMCLDGTAGPNRFGPDPKGRGTAEVFS